MKRLSDKRRKDREETNDIDEFKSLYAWCMLCERHPHQETHHICGRNHPQCNHRTNLLALCRRCHEDLIPLIDLGAQAGIKKWKDPEGFDEKLLEKMSLAKNGKRLMKG